MFLYYLLSLYILVLELSLLKCETSQNQDINPYAYYRIDSSYNGYSITFEDEKIQIKMNKKGDCQNFIFEQFLSNTYYIETRLGSKRLGVDDKNQLVVYKRDNNDDNEKMLWNIKLYEINENNDYLYIIQNNFNKKFLEINEINETYSTLNCTLLKLEDSKYYKAVFTFIKIFEIIDIKPEHLSLIDNEPIDIVIKYIDLTDKKLNREGIPQIKKDQDNEELKYSVRSILEYVPWVRKIFIIMPNEKVRFFKPMEEIKDKFVYVKDKNLIGFDSVNSEIFQLNLFRLKKFGLSDNFIYMEDNYFFGKELKKSDFFYYDENSQKIVPFIFGIDFKEIDFTETINYYNKLFEMRKKFDKYDYWGRKFSILESEKLLLENYNITPMITTNFSHVAIPVNIHDIEECYDLILRRYKYLEEALYSIQKNIFILQSEHLFVLYGLNIKKRKVHSIWYKYFPLNILKKQNLYAPLYAINTDRNIKYNENDYKEAKVALDQRYPERTQYELSFDIMGIEDINNNENDKDKQKSGKKENEIDENINKFYITKVNRKKIEEYKNIHLNVLILFIIVLILVLVFVFFYKYRFLDKRKYNGLDYY